VPAGIAICYLASFVGKVLQWPQHHAGVQPLTSHNMNLPVLSHPERALVVFAAALALLALLGPDVSHRIPAPAHAHGGMFADARTVLHIPHALDVLSNLPFLLFGVWGLAGLRPALPAPQRQAVVVFFLGLLATWLGSSYYHLAPSPWGLMWDRLGMGVAFAGVLGLAVAERVSPRAALATTFVTLVSAMAASIWCYASGDVLPWACIQFGGMLLVLVCACLPRQVQSLGVRWLVLVAIYAAAKLLEGADAAVFYASREWVSGHSLKHVVASLAALPVLAALRRPLIHAVGAAYHAAHAQKI
jgi:hypothetical protein